MKHVARVTHRFTSRSIARPALPLAPVPSFGSSFTIQHFNHHTHTIHEPKTMPTDHNLQFCTPPCSSCHGLPWPSCHGLLGGRSLHQRATSPTCHNSLTTQTLKISSKLHSDATGGGVHLVLASGLNSVHSAQAGCTITAGCCAHGCHAKYNVH